MHRGGDLASTSDSNSVAAVGMRLKNRIPRTSSAKPGAAVNGAALTTRRHKVYVKRQHAARPRASSSRAEALDELARPTELEQQIGTERPLDKRSDIPAKLA
jgi:hypothetical protein